jgi:mRNA interferase RelE/StbE
LYEVVFRRKVEKSVARLPDDAYQRITRAIDNLSETPRPPGCTKLRGRDEWRIRARDYRIVYGIDDGRRVLEVLNVAHRRDVYRRG